MTKLQNLGPAVLALKGLTDAIEAQLIDINVRTVFDPTMSFETVQGGIRATRLATQASPVSPQTVYPLFGWNRGPLLMSQVYQRRSRAKAVTRSTHDGQQINYYTVEGQFIFPFAFYHNDPEQLELYEAGYTAKARISNINDYEVDLPPLGKFTYHVEWGDLDTTIMEKTPVEYMAFTGVALVHGRFVVFDETKSHLLDRLIFDIRDWSARNIYMRVDRTRVPDATTIYQSEEQIPEGDRDYPDDYWLVNLAPTTLTVSAGRPTILTP